LKERCAQREEPPQHVLTQKEETGEQKSIKEQKATPPSQTTAPVPATPAPPAVHREAAACHLGKSWGDSEVNSCVKKST